MNVMEAWRRGYTGKGVVVTIMDDGIDYTHPDLTKSYVSVCILIDWLLAFHAPIPQTVKVTGGIVARRSTVTWIQQPCSPEESLL